MGAPSVSAVSENLKSEDIVSQHKPSPTNPIMSQLQIGQPKDPNSMDFPDIIDKVYVQVFIENLEVTYKLIDDFGAYFKPFIEIGMPETNPEKITILSLDEEKVNNSYYSDNDMNSSHISLGDNLVLSPIKGNLKTKSNLFVFNSVSITIIALGQEF